MTEKIAASFRSWFRCYQPRSQPRMRLACFPHAGGCAHFYRSWSNSLPPTVELLAVQYPGRADRIQESPIADLEQLADLAADALSPALDQPVALFGHSMGAAIAYEVGRRLEERTSCSLVRLFVSGHSAPQTLRASAKHLENDDVLWEEVRRLGGTSDLALVHSELRALILSYLRSDYRLAETYQFRPGPILECPIVACLGDCDPEVDVDEALGWRELTRGCFDLRVFAGDHFYLIQRQAELIDEVLRSLGQPITSQESWPSAP